MKFYEFAQNYTLRQQEEILRKLIDRTDEAFLQGVMLFGHSDELHIGRTQDELLSRTINETVSSSTFNNRQEAIYSLKEALFYNAKDIVAWLNSSRSQFEDSKDFHKKTIDCEIYKPNTWTPTYCKGVNTDCREKKTTHARLILERNLGDITREGQFFFYVKTFFPDINHESARETGINLSAKATELLEAQQGESTMKRTFWALKINGLQPTKSTDYFERVTIFCPFEVNGKLFSVKITDESHQYATPKLSVATTEDGKTTFVKVSKAENITPEEKDVAEKIGQHIHSIVIRSATGASINPENIIPPPEFAMARTKFSTQRNDPAPTHSGEVR